MGLETFSGAFRRHVRAEVKVKYPTIRGKRQQLYVLDCFFFFPKELEAARLSGFYSDLWEVVRLHTPKVSVAGLAQTHGHGSFLGCVQSLLQEVLRQPKDEAAAAKRAAHMLRLHACTMRKAIRKAAQKIHAQISDATSNWQNLPPAAEADVILGRVASMVSDLVVSIRSALQSLQEACQACSHPQLPREFQEAWCLCEEWLLVEAERAMLRLLRDVDECLSRTMDSRGVAGWQIAASKLQPPLSSRRSGSLDGSSEGGSVHATSDLALARAQLQQTAMAFQNARLQKGYMDSLIRQNDAHNNEHFTHRVKILKRHGQEAISLVPKVRPQSQLINDVVGSLIAAIAMIVAVFGLWIGYRLANNQLNLKFVIITVVIYSIKDRIKKWGERYLEPVASWFGYSFPDRIIQLMDEQGSVVGLCKETCRMKDEGAADKHVAALRWQESPSGKQRQTAAMPERVLHLSKSMKIDWGALPQQLQDVQGLDDIMRFDLQHFCRRMEPPSEPHFYMRRRPDGSAAVERLACARVYHINLLLRITHEAAGGGCDSMQLEGARLVLDLNGLVRVERLGGQMLSKEGQRKRFQQSVPLSFKPTLPSFRDSHSSLASDGTRIVSTGSLEASGRFKRSLPHERTSSPETHVPMNFSAAPA